MSETVMQYDVVIVGAGPAGLSAAIRLKQLAAQANRELSVCIVEKGASVGSHILSGAVLEPRALNELIPDWKEKGAPLTTPVTSDAFCMLTKRFRIPLPVPPQMHNAGNYIIRLGHFCQWLAGQAEALGVEIFAGFAAVDVLVEGGRIAGIITGEFGRDKQGNETPSYQPSVTVKGHYTIMAEGCRGSIAERLINHLGLRTGSPQTYGIGIKELWEVPSNQHKRGHVLHSVGWPLDGRTYGGGFLYHLEENLVAVGVVIGLDYQNPHLDPFEEMQRFKTHPCIARVLSGGKRISYGARALNEGGLQSLPKLTFAGGLLAGCAAGFLNTPKIKGTHTAMKSGMIAAEAIFSALQGEMPAELHSYTDMIKHSWIHEELHAARNIRPAFRFGLLLGMAYAALDTFVLRGKAPWTFANHADHTSLRPAREFHKIAYDRADGVLTFDKLSSVFLSGTNHAENQPGHLRLRDANVPLVHNLPLYDAPEQRYCPAGVYEIVQAELGPKLHINAQNCVHCKTCDIKDPTQNIVWVPPEGSGGPNYNGM